MLELMKIEGGGYSDCPPEEVQKRIDSAEQVRQAMVELLPLIRAGKTVPALDEEQTNRLVEKIEHVARTEYRATFFTALFSVLGLANPDNMTEDGKVKLTPKLQKWSGWRKVKPPQDKHQKIGEAANGRVIRSTRTW